MTEPKTALAGVMVENSFARFKASMATFNDERVPPRLFDCRDTVSMAESKRSNEKSVEAARKGWEPKERWAATLLLRGASFVG